MKAQPFGASLGLIDCESIRDFIQYYRGARIFGMGDNPIKPCMLHREVILGSGERGVAIHYIDSPDSEITEISRSWEQLCLPMMKYGHPIQGTIEFGETYAYLSQNSFRESSKGLGWDRLRWYIAGQDGSGDYVSRYFYKHPVPEYAGVPTKEILRICWNILNKQMFEFPEALRLLDSGARLGCHISPKVGLYFHDGLPDIQISYKEQTVGRLNDDYTEAHIHNNNYYLKRILREHFPNNVEII